MKARELTLKQVLAVHCPTCGAAPQERCELTSGQPRTEPHRDRRLTATDDSGRQPNMRISPVNYVKPLVLCIDDSETQLRLRAQVLEKNGFAVLQARTATRSLKLLRQRTVSLVLSDHMLGETTGTELALRIKRLRLHVPVVLYSGAPPNSLAHVDCFIQKDEAVHTVVAILRDLVSRYQS